MIAPSALRAKAEKVLRRLEADPSPRTVRTVDIDAVTLVALLDAVEAAQVFLDVNRVIGGGRMVEMRYGSLVAALAPFTETQT